MTIGTLIGLFILLAVLALIWWGISRLGIPEPIKTVVLVIVGLLALLWLYQTFAGGGGLHLTR